MLERQPRPILQGQTILSAILILLCLLSLTRVVVAVEGESAETVVVRIAGRTCDDWQRLMRSLNLKSDAASALVPEMIELLSDRSLPAELRQQAAFTLGRMQSRGAAAVPLFMRLLDDVSPVDATSHGTDSPRLWSLKSLAYMGLPGREAVPNVVPLALNSQLSQRERLAAIETLSQIGTTSSTALQALWQLTRPASHRPPWNEPTGTQSTGSRPSPFPPVPLRSELEIRVAAVESLAFFGSAASPAIPDLIACARSDSEPLRRATAITLGKIGNDIVIDELVDLLLFDSSPAVRDEAAISLARIGLPAVPTLEQLLGDRESEVRWRAADALGRIGSVAAPTLPTLKSLITQSAAVESSATVHLSAIEAVWRISNRSDDIVPALCEVLGVADRMQRMRAYRLLLKIAADPDHRELVLMALRPLTNSSNRHLRQSSEQALRQLELK